MLITNYELFLPHEYRNLVLVFSWFETKEKKSLHVEMKLHLQYLLYLLEAKRILRVSEVVAKSEAELNLQLSGSQRQS